MLKAKFYDLTWQKTETALVQGVKGNRVPRNALYGGRGSFVVVTEPAKVILELETKYGIEAFNIIKEIKDVTGRKNISEKLMRILRAELQDKDFET